MQAKDSLSFLSLHLKTDRLDLRVVLEHFAAHLTAPAGLLVSSEWQSRVEDTVTVDPDRSRLHCLGHPVCFADIFCPDCSSQTVRRVVHLGDNFVGFFEWHRAHDRTKDLFV